MNTINATNECDNHTRRSFCLLFEQSGLMGPWCAKPPLTYIINPSRLLWLHEGCEEKFIKLTDSIADHNATQRTNRAHAHVYFYTLLSATQLKHGDWLYTHDKMAGGGVLEGV
jgi:hypothetical protein